MFENIDNAETDYQADEYLLKTCLYLCQHRR